MSGLPDISGRLQSMSSIMTKRIIKIQSNSLLRLRTRINSGSLQFFLSMKLYLPYGWWLKTKMECQ